MLARRAQAGRPLLARSTSAPAACARQACRAAPRTERRADGSVPPRRSAPSVRSNIASVSVGNPAIRSAPNAMSGRSARKPRAQADHVGATVAALHALQDQIVAGLHAEVQMRHQARLARDQIDQIGVDLGRIDRGQAQARQLGHEAQQPSDELAESWAGPAGPCRRRSGRPRSARPRGSRRATRRRVCSTTSPAGTLRLGPRP